MTSRRKRHDVIEGDVTMWADNELKRFLLQHVASNPESYGYFGGAWDKCFDVCAEQDLAHFICKNDNSIITVIVGSGMLFPTSLVFYCHSMSYTNIAYLLHCICKLYS